MRYTVYDAATGRILRAGSAPEANAKLMADASAGEVLILGQYLDPDEWQINAAGEPEPRVETPAETRGRMSRELRNQARGARVMPASARIRGVDYSVRDHDQASLAAMHALLVEGRVVPPVDVELSEGQTIDIQSTQDIADLLEAWHLRERAVRSARNAVQAQVDSGSVSDEAQLRGEFQRELRSRAP